MQYKEEDITQDEIARDKAAIAELGEYEDRLVKMNGHWLFIERIVRVDGT